MTCARSAAGRAAARVLPRLLLVIHKLRLIPVVWCHLHHLPKGVIFNMGPLLFHRALCWGVYMSAISVQACIYLSVHVRACVLMCLREYVWEGEGTGEKESVAMHFYTSSHWSLHMKHHGREDLSTYSWAIFLWCNNTCSKSTESLSVALEVGHFPEPSWCHEGKGLEPP